jgi:hyperosmotically inducible periplasmic protein
LKFDALRLASALPFHEAEEGIMNARLIVAVILTSLAFASGAVAQDRQDQRLADQIAANIRTYPQFSIFDDISGEVNNGVVVLTGKVTMPYKKRDIERRIGALDGVRELRSEISVLPLSPYDDSLRYRISRAIYGNPSFWRYGAMANPPIHIVVEHGRVTLTGIVNSNVERMMARSLATGFGELEVVNALRTEMK